MRRSLTWLYNVQSNAYFQEHNVSQIDSRRAEQSIPPNYIHSLDASHMILCLQKLIEWGIESFSMIHDSYGVAAPDVNLMRTAIKETFYDIHKCNQLDRFKLDIEEQLRTRLPSTPEVGDLDIGLVLESDYLFS